MTSKYKAIAFSKMVEVKGAEYVKNHIEHIASSFQDAGNKVEITFLFYDPSYSSSDNCILSGESKIERYFSVVISKGTNKCIKVEDRLSA